MNVIGDVAKELLGMFLSDARLTIGIVVLVAFVEGLLVFLRIAPIAGGAVLLIGSLLIVVEAAIREARRRRMP